MENRSSTYFTLAAVTVATGLLAYAVYFDYKRRNDTDFRKKLKKEKKLVNKVVAQSKEAEKALARDDEITPEVLREALEHMKNEELPDKPEEKEANFMNQVSMGEQLSMQGPAFHLPAAMAFFRALRLYPSPVELMMLYQQSVPEPIFKLVLEFTNLDELSKREDYFNQFPPKHTNVSIVTRGAPDAPGGLRRILVVNKDFAAGDLIYKENPVVSALDSDLQVAGTHCTHCLRAIQSNMSIQLPEPSSIFPSTYCSKPCLVASKSQSTSILFTTDPVLPPEVPAPPVSAATTELRKKAQATFAEYVKKEGNISTLLTARFVARQVAVETNKLVQAVPGAKAPPLPAHDYTDAETDEYLLANHLEPLRYIPQESQESYTVLTNVLLYALPGLEKFLSDERHAELVGKVAYNSIGVCPGGGRDNKPESTLRPEDQERTRTPYGTQRQIGTAFYTVSSYLAHSCSPSARPSFPSGTSELHLIASRPLKKGEEVTIAYVDVTQKPGETIVECRRRRRIELARGWKFACPCDRCEREAGEVNEEEEKVVGVAGRDESKLSKVPTLENTGLAGGEIE